MSDQYPPQGEPQYPGQPQQQPYAYGPPPKKKKTHKFRNFFVLPLAALIVIIVIASVAGGGGGDNSSAPNATNDTTTETTSKTTTTEAVPEDRSQPRVVKLGQAFTIGKHRLNAGWKMQYQEYLGTSLIGSVTNVSKDTSTAFFSVKVLKGNSVLANFQCSTEELEPNQVQQVDCFNQVTTTQRVKGWDKITAEATF